MGVPNDGNNNGHHVTPKQRQKTRPLTASREEIQSRSNELIPRKTNAGSSEVVPPDSSRSHSKETAEKGNAGSAEASNNTNKKLTIDQRPCTSPMGRSPLIPGELSFCAPSPPQSKKKSIKSRRKVLKSKSDSRLVRNDMIEVIVKSTMSTFKPLHLAIRTSTSVRALKCFIQSRTGIASVNTFLVFNDKELKDDMCTLKSVGMESKSVVWVVVKSVSGNNDREEMAALIRMSQSLSTLRHIIKSMPTIETETGKSTSPEYSEAELFVSKEKEHDKMRERMRMLKDRRKKSNPHSVLLMERNAKQDVNSKAVSPSCKQTAHNPNSPLLPQAAECKSSGVLSETNLSFVDVSPVSPKLLNYDPVPITAKELELYFDPAESMEELGIINDEMFDPPHDEEQLCAIEKEIRTTRCGICKVKLPIALREMRCCCEQVYCRTHRNPQDHRCSIDRQAVDRAQLKKTLPKLIRNDHV